MSQIAFLYIISYAVMPHIERKIHSRKYKTEL